MSDNLGPVAPWGEPFSSSLCHFNWKKNLLGCIPIVGIFMGSQRIVAVSNYFGTLEKSGRKVTSVIIRECGENHYRVVDSTEYKCGHYFRGIVEISGLGIVLLITEFVLKLLIILITCVAALISVIYIEILSIFNLTALAIQTLFFTRTKCVSRTTQEESSRENPCSCSFDIEISLRNLIEQNCPSATT
ncbi:hypothetical protein [Chlamydia avium]|uniref:Inner membrane protein n=1 Tax=Chlamydia avium TaxID=1457141 RepID=A0ABN0MRV3_9CHLA|nr:hypothetical protein [Chlamydia avium]EPP35872.1 hypothetical protein CP10743SC13_0634 [Chlamydia psittaci 10_743_SC13]EPP38175.1 hypothetical protein CP10881SC42_0715 [Chlamydia avium]